MILTFIWTLKFVEMITLHRRQNTLISRQKNYTNQVSIIVADRVSQFVFLFTCYGYAAGGKYFQRRSNFFYFVRHSRMEFWFVAVRVELKFNILLDEKSMFGMLIWLVWKK